VEVKLLIIKPIDPLLFEHIILTRKHHRPHMRPIGPKSSNVDLSLLASSSFLERGINRIQTMHDHSVDIDRIIGGFKGIF
jgi:hypothetical protein